MRMDGRIENNERIREMKRHLQLMVYHFLIYRIDDFRFVISKPAARLPHDKHR